MGGRQCGEVVLDSLCNSIEGCMGGTTVWGGSVRCVRQPVSQHRGVYGGTTVWGGSVRQPVSQHRGVYGGDDSVGR